MGARVAALILALAVVGCADRPAEPQAPQVPQAKAQVSDAPRTFVRPNFRKTVILVYHDIIPKRNKDSLWFDCSVPELMEQMDAIAKLGVRFVTLRDIEDELFGGKQPTGPQVAITFADNYAGQATYGWPVLRKRSIPYTSFVHTDYVGNVEGRPKLPWDTLRSLLRQRLPSIGSETCSHPEDITKLTDAELKHEMVDSAKSLREHLDVDVRYVAYPNGKYDERVMEAARAAGYKLGFTESQQPVETATDPMAVPRYVHTKWKQALRDIGVL